MIIVKKRSYMAIKSILRRIKLYAEYYLLENKSLSCSFHPGSSAPWLGMTRNVDKADRTAYFLSRPMFMQYFPLPHAFLFPFPYTIIYQPPTQP